jgi:hypothetical protein
MSELQYNTKEEIFKAIQNHESPSIPAEFLADKEFILHLARNCYQNAEFDAPIELLENRVFVIEVLKHRGDDQMLLDQIPMHKLNDRQFLLEALEYNDFILHYIPDDLLADREFILEAVKQSIGILHYVSKEFLADRKFMLEALRETKLGFVFKFAADELKSDREFVFESVGYDGNLLEYIPDMLKSDRGIVLKAVKNSGISLQYASDQLKQDREIVLEAVRNDGRALEYIPDELRSDREFIVEAVMNYGLYAPRKSIQ